RVGTGGESGAWWIRRRPSGGAALAVHDLEQHFGIHGPARRIGAELGAAGRSESIEAHAAVLVAQPPHGGEEVALLEAVKGLIHGAVVDLEAAAGALLEPFEDLEAVHVAPGEGFEHEHVEVALEDGHHVGHRRRSTKSLR